MKLIRPFIIIYFLFPCKIFAQSYVLPSETVIFSFNTQNGKIVTLNKEKNNHYIVYRFGTKSKTEFEYSDTTNDSWTKFTYSFYLRGGGVKNEGMDLDYVYFINKNYKYVIYNTYVAVGDKLNVGIKIIELTTGKVSDIKGDIKTRKGTLSDFRDNNLLKIGDEIFD